MKLYNIAIVFKTTIEFGPLAYHNIKFKEKKQ